MESDGIVARSVAVWFSKFQSDGLGPAWKVRRISFDVHIPSQKTIGYLPNGPRKAYTLEPGDYSFRGLQTPIIPVPLTIFTKT